MSELAVRHSLFDSHHFFDASAGNINACFVYIQSGSVTVSAGRTSLSLVAGDLFYIPEAIHYTAIWQGSPHIEYYNLEVTSSSYDSTIAASSFALQKIEAMSSEKYGEDIKNMFSLMSRDDKVSKLQAISMYYAFYATAYPLLLPSPPEKFSPVLIKAIQYIEQHYSEDFSVAELASYCFISESRLYHVFTAKLGTTPLKYRNEIRIREASHKLRSTDQPLDRIASQSGFNSASYFRETFKSLTGFSPMEYRRLFLKNKQG